MNIPPSSVYLYSMRVGGHKVTVKKTYRRENGYHYAIGSGFFVRYESRPKRSQVAKDFRRYLETSSPSTKET